MASRGRGDHRFWHEVAVVVLVVFRVVLLVVLLILWIKRDDLGGLAGIFLAFLFAVKVYERWGFQVLSFFEVLMTFGGFVRV